MRSVPLIIGAIVVILLLGAVMTSITAFRTDDYSDLFISTTGGGESTESVILSQELYDSATYNVISISSNNTLDAPLPYSYAAATHTLTVSGLNTADSRLLTIDYRIDGLSEFPGAGAGSATLPMFLILGVIGAIVGAVVSASRSGGG